MSYEAVISLIVDCLRCAEFYYAVRLSTKWAHCLVVDAIAIVLVVDVVQHLYSYRTCFCVLSVHISSNLDSGSSWMISDKVYDWVNLPLLPCVVFYSSKSVSLS